MRVLSIDFGTSNTVAIVRGTDGRSRPLLFDGSPLLPSAVYLNTDGQLLVGRDAERSSRLDPTRFEPNPKRRIDDGVVLLGDRELHVAEVWAAVLRRIAGEAQRQLGGVCTELRLTHPAQWGDRRRAVLIEAARTAGLPAPRLIAEPVAAASYYTAVLGTAVPPGRALGIYDLGGGTFDAAVVRRTMTGFEVLAENGLAELGGLDFDQALVEHLVDNHSDSHTQQWNSLLSPADAAQRRQRGLLYDDVRGAKEMLSRTASADVHLPALDTSVHITREELEGLIRVSLLRTVTCLAQAIDAARLKPTDLVGVFLVGGSSRIPLAAHLIHTELGVAPTTLEQPETVVAEGALFLDVAATAGQNLSGVPRPVAPPPATRPVSPVPPGRPPVTATRPAGAAPISGPPRQAPPARPPVRPVPPVSAVPVSPPHPVPTTAPPAPRPGPRPPVMLPRPPAPVPPKKSWYEEPAIVWTLALGGMVVIALCVLLALL
ncbi:MAG TPA: Hsp70 family protein [Micromonosporaceae bacterium]|nr:Hsp70 family protein [Micromonosporaceae bacterium]